MVMISCVASGKMVKRHLEVANYFCDSCNWSVHDPDAGGSGAIPSKNIVLISSQAPVLIIFFS